MKIHNLLWIAASVVFLSSCGGLKPVGSDRDEHGCLSSAGYLWCAKTEQCERAWDIASSQGLDNEGQTFEDYCRHK